MQLTFDIDEFISYLLNGSLLLFALIYLYQNQQLFYFSGNADYFLKMGLTIHTIGFIALSFLLGHISSVFSRNIVRNLIWRFVKRPREIPFVRYSSAFWTPYFNHRVRELAEQKFALHQLNPYTMQKIAPRIIRSYALERSVTLRDTRNRIVRSRALCANSILPLVVFGISSILSGNNYLLSVIILAVFAMMMKQHDLDEREWKEVYTYFITINN